MNIGFWDQSCSQFTTKLWKPPLKRIFTFPSWESDHPLLPIHYHHNQSNLPDVNLLPVKLYDNSVDKLKKFNMLFGREIGRLDKLIIRKKFDFPFFSNYVTKLQTQLDKIRNETPDDKIKLCFEFSNETFAAFKINFKKKTNVPVDVAQSINAHFDVFDSILIKMKQLDKVLRCYPIRLFPTGVQYQKLARWFIRANDLYNDLVGFFEIHYINCEEECDELYPNDPNRSRKLGKLLEKKNNFFPLNATKIRDMYNSHFSKKHKLPNCVSADIISGFMSNVKGNITKLKKGSINEFKMQRRSFQDICSIPIQQKYTNNEGFYSSIFGPIDTDENNKFSWSDIEHDYKLIYNSSLNRYYVYVPFHKDTKIINNRNPIGIMDPGSAVFQELYGLDHTVSFGVGLHKPIMKRINKIEYLQKCIDDPAFNKQEKAKRTGIKRIQELERKKRYEKEKKEYQALLKIPKKETKDAKNKRVQKFKRIERQEKRELTVNVPNKSSKKKSLNKAIARERRKIKGMVTELHNKTCLYLCKNYDRVMVTNFSCKKVNSKFGKLNKDVKKVLSELSHYRFRQRLQNKCAEYRCQYLEVTEEYTSKTCCNCGNIKHDLGSLREYKCEKCSKEINRDVNGSINIFIKNRAKVVEE